MRRKDREVTDFNKIVSVIDSNQILRLGLSDGDYPYIVPVNFAYEVTEDNHIYFYIHGACAGRKYELLNKNPKCSFEIDSLLKIDYLYDKKDITARYESVMGKATAEFIAEKDKEYIMQNKILTRTQEMKDFDWNRAGLNRCAIIKLSVTEISCKINPVC